jgi:beta-carotene 15,15'-dioxygenase
MILGFHIEETLVILEPILQLSIATEFGLYLAIASYLLHLSALIIYRPQPLSKAIIDISFIAFVSALLPLLLAFAVYFALWHSVQHLHVLRRYLEYDHWWPLVRNGLPFTILALLFLLALGLYLPDAASPEQWIFYAFVGISLMTMPHMVLVDRIMGEG